MKDELTLLLNRSASAAQARDWERARDHALRATEIAPGEAHAHFLAGVAMLELQQPTAALAYLGKAVRLQEDRGLYALYHARALATAMRLPAALEELARARDLVRDDPLALDAIGEVYYRCGFHGQAADVFGQAARLAPDNAGFRYNLGTSLAHHGDLDEAEREFEACVALDPLHWRAHHSLAQLRTQTRERNHLERLQSLVPLVHGKPTASAFLHMALAKELEDVGEHARAFHHMVTAKAEPRRLTGYDTSRDEKLFRSLAELFPEPAGSADDGGRASGEPIFIFGMPRSGTTLVDRILSSHPQVQSAGELFNFTVAMSQVIGPGGFNVLDPDAIAALELENVDWGRLGRDYVASTRPLTGQRPRFTDKLPHNFLYAGFIARALPAAKLVLLRRDPLDTCLGNFRMLFAPESPYFDYSYDLLDIGRYYVLFDALMAHWKQVFPGRILEVRYESIIEDQEAATRRLLDFCGLPWDEACMRFESNRTAVTTASASQVRRPLYRSAMHRWKHYREQIAPLRELLVRAGIDCGDGD